MRRIRTIVFVLVPIHVEVSPTRTPERAVVVSSQDRQSPPDDPPFWSWFGDTTVRLKINLLGNDGGKLVIGFLSSLKIPTNTGDTGNHVWEPGFGIPMNYSLPWGFTFFGQTRIDILDQTRSSSMRVQWQNPIGLSRTIVGNLSGYVEFYDAVSTGRNQPWVGTLDTGLIYQVTPNFSVDVNSFFGLTRSAPDFNVFTGFGYRF
jgi:hypothetical protein